MKTESFEMQNPPPTLMTKQNASAATNKDEWRTLLLIRLLYVTYYMAIGCLQPFLPVYYQSLGYGGMIIGVIGSITPFTTFLVAPLWGMVSDRTGSAFAVLYITIGMSLVGQLLVGLLDDPTHIMLMVCLKSIFGAPVRSLIDSLVMDHMTDRAQYGKMRLWSLIGTGIGTSVAGTFLNDENQQSDLLAWDVNSMLTENILAFWQGLTGYKLIFFAHAVLHIPAFICIRCFQNQQRGKKKTEDKTELERQPKKPPMGIRELWSYAFQDMDTLIFFSLVYAMGISGAIAENFSYIRFREVGGNGSDIGMSRLICSIAGAIMFWYSSSISAWLGMEKVMVLSLLSVAVRFALYVIMDNPYYGYLAEMLRGLTFGCFWSTSTVYASQIAPHEVRATMLQLLNGAYNGIGRSTGAIIGGKMQAEVGTERTFLYFAILNVILVVILVSYTKLGRSSGFAKPDRQPNKEI
jgi:PPP family 3-phenylpropionic acid transporter